MYYWGMADLAEMEYWKQFQYSNYNVGTFINKSTLSTLIIAGDCFASVDNLKQFRASLKPEIKIGIILGLFDYRIGIEKAIDNIRNAAATLNNVYYLPDTPIIEDGIEFFGCSNWPTPEINTTIVYPEWVTVPEFKGKSYDQFMDFLKDEGLRGVDLFRQNYSRAVNRNNKPVLVTHVPLLPSATRGSYQFNDDENWRSYLYDRALYVEVTQSKQITTNLEVLSGHIQQCFTSSHRRGDMRIITNKVLANLQYLRT